MKTQDPDIFNTCSNLMNNEDVTSECNIVTPKVNSSSIDSKHDIKSETDV